MRIGLVLVTVPLASCTSAAKNDLASDAALACDGERYFFGLETLKSGIYPSTEQIDLNAAGVIINPLKKNQKNPGIITKVNEFDNVRLEVCASQSNEMTLLSIAYLGGDAAKPKRFVIDAADKVENLSSMLDGNYENVQILAFGGTAQGVLLRSTKDEGGNAYLYAVRVAKSDAKIVTHLDQGQTTNILVGSIKLGDPFGDTSFVGCTGAETLFSKTIQLGTASLQFDGCHPEYRGGGATVFRMLKVIVTDTNPELTSAQQASITLEDDKLEENSTFVWNHHSGCDSFYINVGAAQYAGSASPMVNCAGTFAPNAPERNDGDKRDLLYRVKYQDKPWSPEAEAKGSRHFLQPEDSF